MPELEASTPVSVQQFLDQNGRGVAVVECYATWCGPCTNIANYVHKVAAMTGVPLIKVNVDNCQELLDTYQVQGMPTFYVIKNEWNNKVGHPVVGGSEENVNAAFGIAMSNK